MPRGRDTQEASIIERIKILKEIGKICPIPVEQVELGNVADAAVLPT